MQLISRLPGCDLTVGFGTRFFSYLGLLSTNEILNSNKYVTGCVNHVHYSCLEL